MSVLQVYGNLSVYVL